MTLLNKESLIDRKQLIERYPALGAKKHRINWLIRTRQIPFTKPTNRLIFFNPRKIDEWIKKNEINEVG